MRTFGIPPRSTGLQAGDARKEISAAKPAGFGELGGGAFGFASEGIRGGEAAALERFSRLRAARFFEPDDCRVDARF